MSILVKKTVAVDGFFGKNHAVEVTADDTPFQTVDVRVTGARGATVAHLEFSPERARSLGAALIAAADAVIANR